MPGWRKSAVKRAYNDNSSSAMKLLVDLFRPQKSRSKQSKRRALPKPFGVNARRVHNRKKAGRRVLVDKYDQVLIPGTMFVARLC